MRSLLDDNRRQRRKFIVDHFRRQRRPRHANPERCGECGFPNWPSAIGRLAFRAVRPGSSARIVLIPTRIASLPWRNFIRGAGFFAGDPFGFAIGGGNFAIQRHRRFDGDERRAMDDPMIERLVQRSFAHSDASPFKRAPASHFNPRASQNLKAWPECFGFGSVAPTITRLIPAAMMASVQGGVRPCVQQGSSVT